MCAARSHFLFLCVISYFSGYRHDPTAFIFNSKNHHRDQLQRFTIREASVDHATYRYPDFGMGAAPDRPLSISQGEGKEVKRWFDEQCVDFTHQLTSVSRTIRRCPPSVGANGRRTTRRAPPRLHHHVHRGKCKSGMSIRICD